MSGQGDLRTFQCVGLSIDLEIGKNNRIYAFGAVRTDSAEKFTYAGGDIDQALNRLEHFARGSDFILGHNIIEHDRPYLQAVHPHLSLLNFPVIDTLRLSPLAFPRNPYHHLVKHYQDGGLNCGRINVPERDASLSLDLFEDECDALSNMSPDLLTAWHRLCTPKHTTIDSALDLLFCSFRGADRPCADEAYQVILNLLKSKTCTTQCDKILKNLHRFNWDLAYMMAWLSVSGENSVMPPWVRHQFPIARKLVHFLRDTPCYDPQCAYCQEFHNATKELKRWFGYDTFRPEPRHNGWSMQQTIVENVMAGNHVLGILPTGTGKSLCYQIPALSRYYKTGALTIVISPLVALMNDQVAGLERREIHHGVTINGMLSIPERKDALERIRLGDAALLLLSPEQLRSRTVRDAIDQRNIGMWVIDEAHCLSKWGHDFRPDYRYVGRFIQEKTDKKAIPPVLCLTATAKPDVVNDIVTHFREKLDINFAIFNGGTKRHNLTFKVIPTTTADKMDDLYTTLSFYLSNEITGSAIIYCATRARSENIAEFLQFKEVAAECYHAGLSPEIKADVQKRFLDGDINTICATNAFGMGIDKSDVRVVIHADIPGSLENYFQEAGRAGRDQQQAYCILLYTQDDVEEQFKLSAHGRLTRTDINAVLKSLRNLDRRKRFNGAVVATMGEILGADDEHEFYRDTLSDDTRIRTSIAWLEEADFLTRDENRVSIFPSSLRVHSCDEVFKKLRKQSTLTSTYREALAAIAAELINADKDEGISTDDLMIRSGLSAERVRRALYDLEKFGIASNDTILTAFVHAGVERSSQKRLAKANALEVALIEHMRDMAPDIGKGDTSTLHLRRATQIIRDQNEIDPLPDQLLRLIQGIAYDGRGEDKSAKGSLSIRRLDTENVRITLHRTWDNVIQWAEIRRAAAEKVLNELLTCVPNAIRGIDILVETTLGKLLQVIEADMTLKSRVREPGKLMDRSLLWLHDQKILRLNKGLAVFRPAMTINLKANEQSRGFSKSDFEPLSIHYEGQILQIHIMEQFAKRGCAVAGEALQLALDYFCLDEKLFLQKWMKGKSRQIKRQTTPQSWTRIVESLHNPVQQEIVSDDREQTNVLVLAGPGSGKTRVLVHRIAYLIRIRREKATGILALAFNRHAALEIRQRLKSLIGNDVKGVTVLTYHGLAMRLVGASFIGRHETPDDETFNDVIRKAIGLLQGTELLPEEADERRQRLLHGFRWILVDEYQDINADQYELISALAGRTRDEDTGKLTLFAVGDDDQNIYAFNGASVKFIRQFEDDYGAKPRYLTDNYRSTDHIIKTANVLIKSARERLKINDEITINKRRRTDPPGGFWQDCDPIARGKVQILQVGETIDQQSDNVITELIRLSHCSEQWDWARCAVIGRQWQYLKPIYDRCKFHPLSDTINAQMANETIPSFWRLRQTQRFLDWIRNHPSKMIEISLLKHNVSAKSADPWYGYLYQAITEYHDETERTETPVDYFVEWLAEWSRDIRRRQHGLLLVTAHRAKGLEFDHVVVLDGGWATTSSRNSLDSERRLYYVAMTRAIQTLTLAQFDTKPLAFHADIKHLSTTHYRTQELTSSLYEGRQKHILQLALEEIDLGFTGRYPVNHSIHHAVAALSIGDPLVVQMTQNRSWILLNSENRILGRFSKKFTMPKSMSVESAYVFAILKGTRQWSDEKYHDRLQSEQWEIIIPELILTPKYSCNYNE